MLRDSFIIHHRDPRPTHETLPDISQLSSINGAAVGRPSYSCPQFLPQAPTARPAFNSEAFQPPCIA